MRRIALLAWVVALFAVITAFTGCGGPDPRDREISKLTTEVRRLNSSKDEWRLYTVIAAIAGVGCLLVGTGLGSRARKAAEETPETGDE